MRHTRYGWWLEDAGPIEATAPLASDTTADVVIVGGGYLGLWSAWQLKQLEPETGRRGARGGPRGPRAERPERRLRLDDLGRPPHAARALRRRARRGGVPRVGARRPRDPRVVRGDGGRRLVRESADDDGRHVRRPSSATGTSSSRPARPSAPRTRCRSCPRRRRAGAATRRSSSARHCSAPPPTCIRHGSRSVCAPRCWRPAFASTSGAPCGRSRRTPSRPRPTARFAPERRCWR